MSDQSTADRAWRYQQSTGTLLDPDGSLASTGYSGHGAGINNGAMEAAHNVGPIPVGRYTIGPAFTHPLAGPVTMRLTPDPANNMHGRDGFMMHGGFGPGDYTASEGCIVMPRTIRDAVAASADRVLVVVA